MFGQRKANKKSASFDAIPAGHLDVGEDDIEFLLANLFQGFVGILGRRDHITFA
jgi:hypothetical protein